MSGTTRKLIEASRTAAPSSYESYYGLVEPPFSLTPGLRFTYDSRSHATALAQVKQALERREGLIVVTGEVGTGKTMLSRALMQDTGPGSFVSLILDPCLSADEILEHVLTDFGVMNEEVGSFGRLGNRGAQVPRHQMLILLQRFLASLIPLGGRAVIVIDEAQHLRPEVLEQIRLWSNFETGDTKLLQIVLAGQSELDDILRRPEMRQIQQRISRRSELMPLSRQEVAEYIEHRLWVARGFVIDPPSPEASAFAEASADRSAGHVPPPIRFTPAAAQAVASVSGGIPRLVNLLCDRALEVGCERQSVHIDKRDIHTAAQRLNLAAHAAAQPEAREPRGGIVLRMPAVPQLTRRAGIAAAAAMLMVAAPFAWRMLPRTAAAATSIASASPASATTRAADTLQTRQKMNVTVATFKSEERARTVAGTLTAGGYPAFVRRDPGSRLHQLIVGPYVSRDAADAARRALAAQGVTGTDMQLDHEHVGFAADMRYTQPDEPRREPRATGPAPAVPVVEAPAAQPSPEATVSYDAAVRPAIERLEQLAPFLVSATTSPDAPVLHALEETLTTLGRSVGALDVPAESHRAHGLLTSAISTAANAVAAGFSGDRVARTRHALDLLDQIGDQGLGIRD